MWTSISKYLYLMSHTPISNERLTFFSDFDFETFVNSADLEFKKWLFPECGQFRHLSGLNYFSYKKKTLHSLPYRLAGRYKWGSVYLI